ncbi:hypothetical protein [Mesorhizobium sp. B1-1-8]|uniref:hypothetical protein n=1 Tax=Mesorhizobium sp. B1-1-8 TaxID=2589976 RepID=UPI00112E2907|nr:hypothetical protein [Mesorhizobium sp. B1-1-8]UCI09977.1 hypothetical protein FJ974_13445 [Mesorhizobium sp. B1-1-8]
METTLKERSLIALRRLKTDARTRKSKRWRQLYCDYMTRTEGRYEELVQALCSLVIQRETLQNEQLRGIANNAYLIAKTSQQQTYLMTQLGLVKVEKQQRRPLRESLMEGHRD